MNIDELKLFIETNKDNYGIQLKRHHRELFDEIDSKYAFDTFGQKLYHYIYGDKNGICEMCGNRCKFDGIHKGYRKRCSYSCMGQSKYQKSHESRQCVICGGSFEMYKNREKTTCSPECLLELNRSDVVNNKRMVSLKASLIKKYGVDHTTKIPGFSDKVKQTKKERYGDENYVNIEKQKITKLSLYGNAYYTNQPKIKATCMQRYGVPNVFHLKQNKTNGKQISKFQRKVYEQILIEHSDAKLEEYLPDVQKSVDIYVPSQKKVIECFGDFWHCNPKLYGPSYYHKYVHMNASEIWERDKKRVSDLQNAGYNVEVIWENAHPPSKQSR